MDENTQGGFAFESPENEDLPNLCDETDFECWIFGSDNRTRRANTTDYPWRTMVGLYPRNLQGNYPGPSGCSGVFVGPRHILTSAHCVWSRADSSLLPVVVVPGLNGIGNEPYGKRGVKHYYIPKGYWQDDSISQEQGRRYDYALLVLWESSAWGNWQGFAAKSFSNLKNSLVWNPGYPASDTTCTNSPAQNNLCSDFLYAMDCALERVYSGYVKHKCDTVRGQSGSPMYHFNNGNRQVVAVYKGGQNNQNWNISNRIRGGNFDAICNWIGQTPSNHTHDCY